MDIGKRIVVHGLLEIDRVEDFYTVVFTQQESPGFVDQSAFRKRFVNTENDNSL